MDDDIGFAVEPITDCSHVPTDLPRQPFVEKPCAECGEPEENWQCLTCDAVLCSRYRQGHMKRHCEKEQGHTVCLSYSDLSLWCYACDSYIANDTLDSTKRAAYIAKFGQEPPTRAPLIAGAASSSA